MSDANIAERSYAMATAVVNSAQLKCECGDAPAPLTVTSQQTVKIGNQLAATINDFACKSIKYPVPSVPAATCHDAIAARVLRPNSPSADPASWP